MSRNTFEKEIDGKQWSVIAFSATEGLGIMARLTNLLGGSIGKGIAGFMGAEDGKGLDPAIIADAFEGLAERMGEEQVVGLVKRMLKGTRTTNDAQKQINAHDAFDVLFMRKYGTLFKVLAFVLEANYDVPLADWLSELPSMMAGEPDSEPA